MKACYKLGPVVRTEDIAVNKTKIMAFITLLILVEEDNKQISRLISDSDKCNKKMQGEGAYFTLK